MKSQASQPGGTNNDLTGAQGFVFQVETLGKGVAAVLISGILLACLMSGMGWERSNTAHYELVTEQARHAAAESVERSEHQRAEDVLRARTEKAETESRMVEYYIMELDGKLLAAGFVPPSGGYRQWRKEHGK